MISQRLLILVAILMYLPSFGKNLEKRGIDKSSSEIAVEIATELRQKCSHRDCHCHKISNRDGNSWEQIGYKVYKTKVIGEDTRRLVGEDEAREASAVGMVVCSKVVNGEMQISAGTGTVVGNRNTIVTNAHNFQLDATKTRPEIRFEFNKDCGFRQYHKSGDVTEVYFDDAEFGDYIKDEDFLDGDWAVLKTNRPLPDEVIPMSFAEVKMDMVGYDSEIEIELIAHHLDKPGLEKKLFYSNGIFYKVEYNRESRLAHTADSYGGASGAALIYKFSDGKKGIIGIHRSGADHKADFNFVVPFQGRLIEVIQNFSNPESVSLKQPKY